MALGIEAQTAQGLITVVDIPDSLMTDEQLSRKQLWESDTSMIELQLVEIGNILTLQEDNHIEITIPGRSLTREFRGTYVEFDSTGDYNWTGELMVDSIPSSEDTTFEYGYLTLLRRGDRVFGEILLDTLAYQIRDLTDSLNALIEIGYGSFAETCAMIDSTGSGIEGSEGVSVEARSTTLCPVTMLILYTEAAEVENPDIEDIAELAFFNTRKSLKESHVGAEDLTFTLKEIVGISNTEWQETGDITFDRFSLVGDSEIEDYRTEYAADIVVILTGEVYANVDGAVTAIGDLEADVDSAYAIVEASGANLRFYAFAHETFHLFGCRHETMDVCAGSYDNTGPFAHGFLVRKKGFLGFGGKDYWTVMAICLKSWAPNNVNMTMHISNPDVKYKHKKTGDSGHDNVKQLRESNCRISNYIVSEAPQVIITGPFQVCPNDAIYLDAIIYGSTGPFIYYWSVSDDGVNYGSPVQSQSSHFVVQGPHDNGDIVYIKLTAGNVNGPLSTNIHAVKITDDIENCMRHPISIIPETTRPESVAIEVFPNPSSERLTISIVSEGAQSIKGTLRLISCTGEVVRTILVDRKVFNLTDVPAGCYFLTYLDTAGLTISSNSLVIMH